MSVNSKKLLPYLFQESLKSKFIDPSNRGCFYNNFYIILQAPSHVPCQLAPQRPSRSTAMLLPIATKPSPRKVVTQTTGDSNELELLTSSRTNNSDCPHESPIASPIASPIPFVSPFSQTQIDRFVEFTKQWEDKFASLQEAIISEQKKYLADSFMSTLPEVFGFAVESKLKDAMEPVKEQVLAIANVTNSNETRLIALTKMLKVT